MEEKELELTPSVERQLKGLNQEEQKEYKRAIDKYDLDRIYNYTLDSFALRGEINTPENILRDLKKLPKQIEKEDSNTIYLKSKKEILHFGYLEFYVELRYDMPQNGLVTVYLILKEPVSKAGGLFIDYTNNTIAHLVLPNDKYLFDKIATEFNISGTFGGRSRREIDYEPLSVLRAKRYLYILAGHVVFATCSENRRFLESRFNLLQTSEVGRRILQEFNRLITFIPNTLSYEQTIFAQNQLLTNILRQFESLFSSDRRLFMNLTLLNAEYRTNINEITDEICHHITLENFEEHLNIPTAQNQHFDVNIPTVQIEEERTI